MLVSKELGGKVIAPHVNLSFSIQTKISIFSNAFALLLSKQFGFLKADRLTAAMPLTAQLDGEGGGRCTSINYRFQFSQTLIANNSNLNYRSA